MNKALIVIDVQNGLTLKKKLYQIDSFFNAVNLAIDSFRASRDLIIFVQHNNKMLVNGTDDWQLDARLNRNPDDLVLQKQNGNAFLEHQTRRDAGLKQYHGNHRLWSGHARMRAAYLSRCESRRLQHCHSQRRTYQLACTGSAKN